jgi:C-terminal processing protease CtpA/Prc
MTRHLFWVAMAATVSMWSIAQEQRAFAQEQEAAEEAQADTNAADAEASADAGATQSSEQAESQPANNADASAQADTQSEAADTSATTDAQATTSDRASDQDATGAQNQQRNEQDAIDHQSSQGTPPSVPAPTDGQDPNATQRQERSRLVDGQQQPGQQDAAARDRQDSSRQDRDRADDGRGRGRGDDVRVGIAFGRATDRGLAINNIERNSFYFRSGFRQNDVIVSVHGRPIRSDADFYRLIVVNPGQRVPVIVLRDGRRETIYVTYHDVAYNEPGYQRRSTQASAAYLGVVFDPQVRDAAVVRGVNPGSPAEEAGLQAGDIIIAMNGQEVRSYPEAISVVRQMRPGDELPIVIERARGENEVVAILDQRPNVRTAARPDSQQYDRQTITTEESIQGDVQVDQREDGRILERDRNSDDSRGRVLPRLRN